jgi:lysozyme family protein
MILTDEALLTEIMEQREGSTFTNKKDDAGGATRWGITQDTLSSYLGRPASVDEVANLTEDLARRVYETLFVVRPGFAQVGDPQLRGLLVDCGVLHGPKNGVRFLQRALHVADDGVFGNQTLTALAHADTLKLRIAVFGQRMRFLGRLITSNLTDADKDGIPDNTEHAAGWLNRFADVLGELV